MALGLTGRLLSSSFLEMHLSDQPPNSRARLQKSSSLLGPASSVRAVLDAGARPFLDALRLGEPRDVGSGRDLVVASVGNAASPVALLVTAWGAPLHSHWRTAIEQATRRRARWCLLYNAVACRLMDATRPHSSRFAEFDLDVVADDDRAAAMFQLVTGALPDALSALVSESERYGVGVCRSLRDGVLEASADILAAILRPTRKRHRVDVEVAFEQSLTIVYRLLFLLFAESRQLVPLWHPIYRHSYAIETLVTLASRDRAAGLWDALRAVAHLAHTGCRAGDLRVTPFNGRLFAPTRTPLAERRDLDDEQARRALLSLATRTSSAGGNRERIAYRDLGVEELGGVYESLLDYRPLADPVRLVPGAGVRKSTGTFYTPRAIADYLIRATLAPLTRDARPHEILSLRVVDPAMGSGAFLVAACHYLAQAYELALIREDGRHAIDITEAERASIRRTIAERCLYGVDINPMAVQLARLSLWLTTLAADRPLTFLDHRLLCGDSLLGASLEHLRSAPVARRHLRADTDHGQLFDEATTDALRSVLPIRFSLERTPDDTIEHVRAKEHALASLQTPESALMRWKRVADVWCASWLSPEDNSGVPPGVFHALSDQLLNTGESLAAHVADRYLGRAHQIAAERRLFHWELEFPEVFFDSHGQRLARAGFDAVVSNPPWEMIRADVGTPDARSHNRQSNTRLFRFIRNAGGYPSATGHVNLYQLFTDRTIGLLRDGGRLGLLLPSGLATDHGSGPLRRRLIQQCAVDALVGLDNQQGLFAIHRSVKFLLTTATKGSATQSIACRLGETDVTSLDAAPIDSRGSDWFRVRLTPALLETLSGPALVIPDLRTDADVAIAERAARLFPPLGSDAGWSARFGRELNATDDRHYFGPVGLPIVEGKHLEPFRVHTRRCEHHVKESDAARLLANQTFHRPRLAYRDVASATNKTTLIAAMLPPGCLSTHTLFCLRTSTSLNLQCFLCGLFNSLVVNYLVRMRVTTHVTTATVERLPIPPPGYAPSPQREIAALARVLSRRDDKRAWIRLQVLAASVYQLTPEEFRHVLSTFPLIASEDREAARVAYEVAEALVSSHED